MGVLVEWRALMQRLAIVTTAHSLGDPRIVERGVRTALGWGLEVHLFVPADAPMPAWMEGQNLYLWRLAIPSNRFKRLWLSLTIRKYLRAHGTFDVIHFHDPELIPAMLIERLAGRTKILYDIHEELPIEVSSKAYIPKWWRPLTAFAVRFLWWLSSKVFDGFAPATEQIATYWPKARTQIVHNYPRRVYYRPDSSPSGNRIVFAGGLDSSRGVHEAIAAVRGAREFFPDATLELYGPLSDESLELPLSGAISEGWCKHIPWLDQEQLANTLSGATIGLVPYPREPCYMKSLPTKLFEYMALGIPALVSAIPLWKHLVSQADCGTWAEPTAPEIADAIRFMLKDRRRLESWSENGKRAYFTKYRWESENGHLAALYVRLGLRLSPI